MSTEQNKAIVGRMFEEAINRKNVAVLDEVLAPDMAVHSPIPVVAPGSAGFKKIVDDFLTAFPDQRVEIHEMLAEGDRVAVRHTHHVVHGGPFLGVPASGKRAAVDGIEIFRIADGRIAEFWHNDDLLSLLQQLGMIPSPAAAA